MSLFVNRKILLILSALFITWHALAQSSAYSVTHYTNENGLPQNSVKSVEVDKNGFMWLTTESGIVRFDGQHFKMFDKIQSGIGLTSDSLILFSVGSKLYTFNNYNQLVSVKYEKSGNLLVPVNIYRLYTPAEKQAFSRKNIWFCEYGTHENEILPFKINGAARGFVFINRLELRYISGKHLIWNRHISDCNSTIVKHAGGIGENLYYIDTGSTIRQVDQHGNIHKVTLKGIDPVSKVKNPDPYQYGLFQHGEELYLLLDKRFYKLSVSGEHELTATLMLETDVQGINVYRNYPGHHLQVIGSATQGLYLFHKKQFKALTFKNGWGNFYPQAPYQDSGVLTAMGLIFPHSSRLNYPFKIEENRGILLDRRGHYWVNKSDQYLRSFSAHLTELDENLKPIRTLRSLHGVDCYRETPDGNIWMCRFRGQHLGKLDGDSIAWLKKVWPVNSIITFLPENNEVFWVAGYQMLMKLNVRTRAERHYKNLEQFRIESLYSDRNKVLWIGTSGNGFYALKQDKLYRFPLDKKRNLNTVHTFLEDKSGFMWMSTNNGLFRCKKEDLDNFIAGKITSIYYQCFNKESGFNTNEFNGSCTPSGIVFKDGKFSLPSLDGLVQFYPDSIREALPANGIFIDRLLIDGKEQDLSREIILNPSFKRLQIEFASPFFGIADNQQIEYNVKGLDQNWYPVNSDNQVILNGLPHGNYSLQFRKLGGFGNNNVITKVVSLKVLPFFYQTWGFIIAVVVITGLIILLLVKRRNTLLLKRNKQLEQEVAQRTLHLRNANHLKEKILMMVGHDLQSPLHFLGYLSETNYDALMSRQHKKAGLISQEMKNTTKKIYAFVDEFNLWARVQDEQFNLKKTIFSLTSLVEELQLFFKEILQLNQNTLECTTEGEYELHTNRELLKAVLRNLIDNANKHTHSGTIHIHCKTDDETTCFIHVSDTGKGMSPEVLKKINDLIKRSVAIDFDSGSRLGYQFIIDFATRLNTQVTVTSEENEGTTVLISGIALHQANHKNKKSYPTP